jgi:putative membrane protein
MATRDLCSHVTGSDDRRDSDQGGPGVPYSTGGTGAAGAGNQPAESEPDARFTLANQRTFLAWSRTALALVAAGLGIVQLLPPFPGVPWGRHVLGLPLILLGAVIAARAYREWTLTQTALRRGDPLPGTRLPLILAVTIAVVAAASAVVAIVSVTR